MDKKTRQKVGDKISDCVNRQSFTSGDMEEICQMFEPKPDDSLLLSDEEIAEGTAGLLHPMPRDILHVCRIVAKTQLIEYQEHEQKVVAEIFREIESHDIISNVGLENIKRLYWYKALKARYVKEK